MILFRYRWFKISNITKYRIRSVLFIALLWTLVDWITVLLRNQEIASHVQREHSLWMREILMFILSVIMGYLFVYKFKRMMRHYPLWFNFIAKSIILLASALVISFLIQFVSFTLVSGQTPDFALHNILVYALHKNWLLQKIIYWIVIFFVTQLFLLINERYSPGVFMDIFLGRYTQPKIEKRIIMFMDLKDSTPIAEKLGHQLYFKFIRDFIYQVSAAIIEYEGRIYQYVGDEAVSSWLFDKMNTRKCMDAVILARKNIQKKSEHFRREYGIVPEFRVGIHLGDVTVGEIGVIKKDLAMTGDTMNTTARIRSATNELNHNFIVSKVFMENIDLEEWQTQNLGPVDLKGKGTEVELFSLNI
ncbi:MAG: adenylate/guanylate cyclase protein [Chitinophagaceae bacterium]|nr:adenylate/guanylate cyclase protein [Chitinophagaceae bacterium]MDB5223059.1 adenylate/guanylate cyclase protein [Chitinophagaceae bacterium]